LPISFFGYDNSWRNLKRLRWSDFCVAIGRRFRVRPVEGRVTGETRQAIVGERMFEIACLLLEGYRGEFTDMPRAASPVILPDPAGGP
jgi:hypothetical protein